MSQDIQTIHVAKADAPSSVFMTSLSKEYYQTFLAQAVGLGLSMGCTYMPAISVINHYFRVSNSFCTRCLQGSPH